MKKTIGIILILAFSFFSVKANEPEPQPKIGFLIANFINLRWYKDRDYFTEKVKELGGIPYVMDAVNNPENQINQAKELIQEGVDVLVVVPVDAKSAGQIIGIAHEANVPVIAYDRLIMDSDLDYYVSFNSVKVGELMAQYVTKMVPKGTYAFINGPVADHNSILIKQGVMNVLNPYLKSGEINLVYNENLSEWIELDAFLTMDKTLEEYPDIDVIVSASDILSRGVLMALDGHTMTGKVLLTGQDGDLQAIQDILQDRQTMTLYKSTRTLGERTAEIAVRLAKGDKSVEWPDKINNGKIDVPSVLFDPVIVDKSNVNETVIKDGHLTEEEVYGSIQ